MRRACSRRVDLRPGNGAELRRSPAVPSHRPASTRPTVSPTLSCPVLEDTQIPAAQGFGMADRACLCPAFLHIRFYSTALPTPPQPLVYAECSYECQVRPAM